MPSSSIPALLAATVAALAVHHGDGGAGATIVVPTRLTFDDLVGRLEKAVVDHGLLLIAKPSASRNAAGRGIHIPGNAVILTFNNDLALRLLAISVAAGFEAPVRLYITENADHTATVSYRSAEALFAPYSVAELVPLARDIDDLLAKVVADATRGGPPAAQ